jgi:protein TonB
MIRYAVNRKRPTSNGMAISMGLHALLLFVLLWQAGRQVAVGLMEELTEIAYIEAHYGEDVAAKVKMKTMPLRDPQLDDPGRGISSDSMLKPKAETPEPPRPESKPSMAEVDAPQLQIKKPDILAVAEQLQGKTNSQNNRPIVDTSKLRGGNLQAATDAASPQAMAAARDAFRPQTAGLQSRSNKIIITDKPLPAGASSGHQMRVAEAGTNLVGGNLRSSGGNYQNYRAPESALAPTATGNSKGGRGVMDVTGPAGGTGGSESSARKTILDYGSGNGGGGSGLVRRGTRIVEKVDSHAIVEDESAKSGKSEVADVKMDSKGVKMTISGQISGRKILHSVAPVYSEKAKRNGWEGAVAVHFTVLADGRVKDNLYFDQTSAHRDLNRAAMEAIKQFRFAPLPTEQAVVEQWGVITIIFRLN